MSVKASALVNYPVKVLKLKLGLLLESAFLLQRVLVGVILGVRDMVGVGVLVEIGVTDGV